MKTLRMPSYNRYKSQTLKNNRAILWRKGGGGRKGRRPSKANVHGWKSAAAVLPPSCCCCWLMFELNNLFFHSKCGFMFLGRAGAGSSHSILASPLAGKLVVLFPVCFVYPSDFWHQRIIGIRIAQQRTD